MPLKRTIDFLLRCKCVEYLDSSFWYCGIFLIINDKSFTDCLSLWLMRFDSVNRFRFCVTNDDTIAMCWWRSSSHSSSFSSSNTSFSWEFGDGKYLQMFICSINFRSVRKFKFKSKTHLYTSFVIGSKSYAMACKVSSCKTGVTQSKPRSKIKSCDRAFSTPSPMVGSSSRKNTF